LEHAENDLKKLNKRDGDRRIDIYYEGGQSSEGTIKTRSGKLYPYRVITSIHLPFGLHQRRLSKCNFYSYESRENYIMKSFIICIDRCEWDNHIN
jgi:hypothetical protein